MSRIVVIGGTGYAGSAIVSEAARRGHDVTALSRNAPKNQVSSVKYVQGDVTDQAVLKNVIQGTDVVVAALSPRGELATNFRAVNRDIMSLASESGSRLFVVGGYSSLRPARGADRFVSDISNVPEAIRGEVLAGAALILEDLPAAPENLDWVFVSPPLGFGAHVPTEPVGKYTLGDDVAVDPETGGKISAEDYALGLVDLIEANDHHRAQVNLAQ